MDELTDRDRQVLAFERKRWLHAGARDDAVMKTFGITPTRYQQYVLALIDRPAALLHDPMLVKRLRRLRETRRSHRARPAGKASGFR